MQAKGGLGLLVVAAALALPMPAFSAAFVVTTNADTSDAVIDGSCDDGTGACSLRGALQEANASVQADSIVFAIGSGLASIDIFRTLPWITSPVVIDGTTQPGYTGAPVIEIRFGFHGGLVIAAAASGTRITGLALQEAGEQAAISIGASGVVDRCHIGVSADGNELRPSDQYTSGVIVTAGNGIEISRNVIAGSWYGIALRGGNGIRIQGNRIGTDGSGLEVLGNRSFGIGSDGHSSDVQIGGSDPGTGNVISGNCTYRGCGGVSVLGSGVVIQGNRIGCDVTGTIALGNGSPGDGLSVNGSDVVIGGSSGTEPSKCSGACNLVSGNEGLGILLSAQSATVRGNWIGVDATGTASLPNSLGMSSQGSHVELIDNLISGNLGDGVYFGFGGDGSVRGNRIGTSWDGRSAVPNQGNGIVDRKGHLRIGGSTPSERNVISGNGSNGILYRQILRGLGADVPSEIVGNTIGADATGQVLLPNGGNGIAVLSGESLRIGGTFPGEGNVIAGNAGRGIAVTATTPIAVWIRHNSIGRNGGLGIDLTPLGVTANDPLDADTGACGLQNFPVITLAAPSGTGTGTRIAGYLDSAPSTTYAVEVFASAQADASGYGEGETFLAEVAVTTGASGRATFDTVVPVALGAGVRVAATATDPASGTSEFGAAFVTTPVELVHFTAQ